MKELTFNRNSWHFKLIKFFDMLPVYSQDRNLCVYIRRLLICFLLVILLALAGLMVLYCIGDFIGWIAYCIMHGQFTDPSAASKVIIIALSFAVVLGALWIGMEAKSNYRDYRMNARYEKESQPGYKAPEPNFLKATYTTFKDKVCYKISFD